MKKKSVIAREDELSTVIVSGGNNIIMTNKNGSNIVGGQNDTILTLLSIIQKQSETIAKLVQWQADTMKKTEIKRF